ncbi:unannotated protein [freshwater metagenome]
MDETTGMRNRTCALEFIVGNGITKRHILSNRIGEEKGFLEDECDFRPNGDGIKLSNVHTIEQHRAAIGVNKARNQLAQGGLARTGNANERHN